MGLNKPLDDFQMKNGDTLNNKMIIADIVDNDLVLKIQFDNPRIAVMQYLQLAGYDMADKNIKEMIDMIVFPPVKP